MRVNEAREQGALRPVKYVLVWNTTLPRTDDTYDGVTEDNNVESTCKFARGQQHVAWANRPRSLRAPMK
jgi:hypothetical protein